jgi:ribokinase
MLRQVEARTGSGIGFIDSHGENCLAVYPGANLLLSAQDIRSVEQAVREAGLVLAQFETGDEPILEAFTIADAAGARTVLNPSPYRPVDPRIIECTTILVLNQVEAAHMAGTLGHPANDHLPETLDQMAAETGQLSYNREPLRCASRPFQSIQLIRLEPVMLSQPGW